MLHLDDTLTQSDNLRFIRSAMNAPMLEKEEELGLARAWRENGDEKSLHKLIKSYARLAVATAARFRHYGLPFSDLIQEGHIGLLQAANRFEADRGVRFSTYAQWWIRASIQDYVLRNWSIVRTGTTAGQKALFFNLRKLKARIEGKARRSGNDETLPEDTKRTIASSFSVSITDVEFMDRRLSGGDYSLNADIGEEGTAAFQDFLKDDGPSPEENAIVSFDGGRERKELRDAIATLDAREQRIIRERHLAEEESAATLEDLGEALGISKERVRQLEARAFAKLKARLEAPLDKQAA